VAAKSLLQRGIVLDYEIKKAYRYRPIKRCQGCKAIGHKTTQCPRGKGAVRPTQQGPVYYTEPGAIGATFLAGETPIPTGGGLRGQEEGWTLVEGTQKGRLHRLEARAGLVSSTGERNAKGRYRRS
jgi:hypothetical protein